MSGARLFGGEMQTVAFNKWLKLPKDQSNVFIDLDTVPSHMARDYANRNDNLAGKKKLCDRCDGTGNELFSMYRKCHLCDGKGAIDQKKAGE